MTVVGIPCQPIWRTECGRDLAGPRHVGFDVDHVPLEARLTAPRDGPERGN